MRAFVKQFFPSDQRIVGSDFKIGKITVPNGSYVAFGKADIRVLDPFSGGPGANQIGVSVFLKASNGGKDTCAHTWERPRNSTHRTETIALNLGVSFNLDDVPVGAAHPPEFGTIEMTASATDQGEVFIANVTLTVLSVDSLEL